MVSDAVLFQAVFGEIDSSRPARGLKPLVLCLPLAARLKPRPFKPRVISEPPKVPMQPRASKSPTQRKPLVRLPERSCKSRQLRSFAPPDSRGRLSLQKPRQFKVNFPRLQRSFAPPDSPFDALRLLRAGSKRAAVPTKTWALPDSPFYALRLLRAGSKRAAVPTKT